MKIELPIFATLSHYLVRHDIEVFENGNQLLLDFDTIKYFLRNYANEEDTVKDLTTKMEEVFTEFHKIKYGDKLMTIDEMRANQVLRECENLNKLLDNRIEYLNNIEKNVTVARSVDTEALGEADRMRILDNLMWGVSARELHHYMPKLYEAYLEERVKHRCI